MSVSSVYDDTNDCLPVAVITAREPVTGNPWISERWRVLGVVAGGDADETQRKRTLLRAGPEGEQYLWSGFVIRLRKSEADSYYFNLIGGNPSVYVLWHSDDGGELIPEQTTIEYIDATAHSESGNESDAVPMPPEIYKHVERYVLENYELEEPRRKRKRDDANTRRYEPQD